jgi:hypothetical protein
MMTVKDSKEQIFPKHKKNHLDEMGKSKKREDVDAHQGTDTLVVFVRKSSRVSGGIVLQV